MPKPTIDISRCKLVAEAKVRSSEVVGGRTAVIHDHRDVLELVSAHGLLGQTLVNAAQWEADSSTPRVTTPSPCILNRWDELGSFGTDVRNPTEQAGGITARGSLVGCETGSRKMWN